MDNKDTLVSELIQTIRETNTHLKVLAENSSVIAHTSGEIATTTKSVKRFGQKWGPWLIVVFSLTYPKLAQFIQSLPLPHG